jgi:hypothetical protein
MSDPQSPQPGDLAAGAGPARAPGARRRRAMASAGVATALLVGLLAAVVVGTSRSHTPAHQPLGYVAAEAAALHDNPLAIVAFVRDKVATDEYPGVLRGPVGTLWTKSGNGVDRALLLQALLQYTPARTELVHGRTWGVEMATGSGRFAYVGPNTTADPGAVPQPMPASDYQTVSFDVQTVAPGGATTDEFLGTYRTAELSANDIVVSYRQVHGQVNLVLSALGSVRASRANAATAVSQTLEMTLNAPGVAPVTTQRQLFTDAYPDYLSTFDPSDRYDITVTTGWVPLYVAHRESAAVAAELRERAQPAGLDATDHVLAYTFLAASDANTWALAGRLRLAPHVTSPRITIVGNVANPEDPGTRVVSLDLRKNNLVVSGSLAGTQTINANVSMYDASLESQVLAKVTGQPTISGADLLAAAVGGEPGTLPQRLATLGQSVLRLLDDDLPNGTSLSVTPVGHPADGVVFTRQGARVQVTVAAAVRQALATSADPDTRWLLGRPDLASDDDVVRAALATDSALSHAAQVTMDYTDVYRFRETPEFYWDLTAFSPHNPEQQLAITTTPSVQIRFLPYYFGNNRSQAGKPISASMVDINISDHDLQSATVIQDWFDLDGVTTDGYLVDMVSRKVFSELVARGSAVVRFRSRDSSGTATLSAPVRIYNMGAETVGIEVNGVITPVRVLQLNGYWAKDRLARPKSPTAGPDIYNPYDRVDGAINKFAILDDPNYPFYADMFWDSGDNQTDIQGGVTDASTGDAVNGATVSLARPALTVATWPDGSFSLPAFNSLLGTAKVQVSAPGYATLTATVDFADPKSFPLRFRLQPLAATQRAAMWVDGANAAKLLPTLGLTDRSRGLIAQLVSDPAVSVLVPAQQAVDDYGPIDVWTVFNRSTGELYPMLPDGLYGATTNFDIMGFDLGAAKKWAHDKLNKLPADQAKKLAKNEAKKLLKKLIEGDEPYNDKDIKVALEPLSFYAGHVAGWYYFAAGALTAVSANMDDPDMTMCEFHAITTRTAILLVKSQFGKDKSFGAGALLAVNALGHRTFVEWGLVGTGCNYNPLAF